MLNILEMFQSGLKSIHSTETATWKFFDDLATDLGDLAVLLLLDPTASFDMELITYSAL